MASPSEALRSRKAGLGPAFFPFVLAAACRPLAATSAEIRRRQIVLGQEDAL
jgi:hypothetical protein